ncbi:MAG: baseplate J/gp47 family protein [Lachnospiraceae bacterium]|nr:baseplate J/gp47 family protein [Lachnospiraceae bacterium]
MSDIKFIETDSSELYSDIISKLEQAVGEPLYPGDERRIFGEGLVMLVVGIFNTVNEAAKAKMLKYASGIVLDALGERTNTIRIEATSAVTTMRFSIVSPISNNIIIPVGTRVTPDNEIYFATKDIAVIEAGNTYVDVEAKAELPGDSGNRYVIGVINQLVDLIPNIDEVKNTVASHGGDDGEPYTEDGDNNYRERIRLSATKFTTAGPKNSYKYYALSADSTIEDVAITSPSAGTVLITPICQNGVLPSSEVLQKVLAICSADNVRPMTDQVIVMAPETVNYDISIKYYTTEVDEQKCVETIEGAGGAVEQYKSWQDSILGRDINPDKLRALLLVPSNGTGAIRVDMTAPVRTVVDQTKIAKCGTVTITHEVVEE